MDNVNRGITAEQEHQVEVYYKSMETALRSCAPANRETAEASITKVYKMVGRGTPEFVWLSSPVACLLAAEKEVLRRVNTGQIVLDISAEISEKLDAALPRGSSREGYSFAQHRIIRTIVNDLSPVEVFIVQDRFLTSCGKRRLAWHGQFDAHWVAGYRVSEILRGGLSEEALESLGILENLVSSCGGWIPLEDKCFISDRCSFLYLHDDNVLRTARPGECLVKYRDGAAFYKTE